MEMKTLIMLGYTKIYVMSVRINISIAIGLEQSMKEIVWGLDIGGTKCAISAVDETGNIVSPQSDCNGAISLLGENCWDTLISWAEKHAPAPVCNRRKLRRPRWIAVWALFSVRLICRGGIRCLSPPWLSDRLGCACIPAKTTPTLARWPNGNTEREKGHTEYDIYHLRNGAWRRVDSQWQAL